MLDLIEVRIAYKERLQEAEQERFARRARQQQQPAVQRAAHLRPLLANLGDGLIALGQRLKKQGELSLDYSRQ